MQLGDKVEVLGFDDEPKYEGVFTGQDTPGTYHIWIPDAEEFTDVPAEHVRKKEEA